MSWTALAIGTLQGSVPANKFSCTFEPRTASENGVPQGAEPNCNRRDSGGTLITDLNETRGHLPNPRTVQKKSARPFRFATTLLVCTILLLLLEEGLASYAYVTQLLFSHPLPIVGGYTQFDKELGWVTIPNVYLENLFGPGIYFRSNSQGFRNDKDFSREIPRGKIRIICSGDSFTMGYGVSNDQTWCQLLAQMDDRIQTVNMGQAAYGIDQAYLWYERDGSKLDLDLHIFAFIYDDFARMTFASHWGYGKPILVIENEQARREECPCASP